MYSCPIPNLYWLQDGLCACVRVIVHGLEVPATVLIVLVRLRCGSSTEKPNCQEFDTRLTPISSVSTMPDSEPVLTYRVDMRVPGLGLKQQSMPANFRSLAAGAAACWWRSVQIQKNRRWARANRRQWWPNVLTERTNWSFFGWNDGLFWIREFWVSWSID